jgi:membrane protease YdiL (CAAX protease family)
VLELTELLCHLEAWLILAVSTGLPVFGLWFCFVRRHGHSPLPRSLPAPWSGLELIVIFLLVQILWPSLANELLMKSGLLTWLYGPDPQGDSTAVLQEIDKARSLVWTTVLAFPFQVATMICLPFLASATKPAQLGLTSDRAASNIFSAWLIWLVLAPLVYAVHIAVNWVYLNWWRMPLEPHPLMNLPRTDWFLMVLSATITAPILEELLFRGLMQRWFASRSRGGDAAMLAAFAFALLGQQQKLVDAWRGGATQTLLRELHPVVFVLLVLPGYFLVPRLARRWVPSANDARAIYGTSLLFAIFHISIWPTPIPLFLLGLGLGFLAYRTQSLLASILVHSLFNGIACVAMLLGYAAPVPNPTNGKDATSAIRRPPAVAISSLVPGSWQPRRIYASAIAVSSRGDTTKDVTCPTSSGPRNSLAAGWTGSRPWIFRPMSDRFTWPISRARTIGS